MRRGGPVLAYRRRAARRSASRARDRDGGRCRASARRAATTPSQNGACERRQRADHARVGVAAMGERQQHQFQILRPALARCVPSRRRPRRSPRRRRRRAVAPAARASSSSHRLRNGSFLSSRPNSAHTRVPGEAERMAPMAVEFQNEHVAERAADRARLDLAAFRRGRACRAARPNSRTARGLKPVSLFALHAASSRIAPSAVPVRDSGRVRPMRRGGMSRACAADAGTRRICDTPPRLGLLPRSRWQERRGALGSRRSTRPPRGLSADSWLQGGVRT